MAEEIVVKESSDDLESREGEKQQSWSELPLDLLSLVSSHLFAKDPGAIGTVRLTCKAWGLMNPIVPPPLDPLIFPHNNYPYLMSLKDNTCRFFHPIYNHNFRISDIPEELSDAVIQFSKQGWLLLTQKDGGVFFHNPCSRTTITLPKIPPRQFILTLCFSSPPNCSNCYILGVWFGGDEVIVLKFGDAEWKSYPDPYLLYSSRFITSYCHPVIYKEKCYFLGEKSMRVFDLKDKKFSTYGLSLTQSQLDSLYRSFLVENDGELLAVFVTKGEQSVFVKGMKLTRKMVWRPIEKLSNKMLYISYGACFLVPALARATGNKIYFPKILSNNCIFYSLATRKYHSFSGDYSSGVPRYVKELTNCAWVEWKR